MRKVKLNENFPQTRGDDEKEGKKKHILPVIRIKKFFLKHSSGPGSAMPLYTIICKAQRHLPDSDE